MAAFEVISGGLDFAMPRWRRIAQKLHAPREESIDAAVTRELRKLDGRVRPGMRIAVGIGSRGIARIAEIAAAVVRELKARGALPFVVPAMGSHGGGTPEGQLEVLRGYGVTPEALGVPFEATMETVVLGTTPGGLPVHWSRAALEADAVLPINRVKLHTEFHGEVESGISKMLAIGLSKQAGATLIHRRGFDTFHELVPELTRLVLSRVRVLGGLASVENAREEIARLEFLPAEQIGTREPELLRLSRELMPRVPFDRLDVLIVDWLGKNISGVGMDPNVTGRYSVRHLIDPRNPKKLVALRLTELTHGNACGIGLADVTTRAVIENVDYQKHWTNVIASTELAAGKTPIWMPDDRRAIALALATANRVDPAAPRLVRIESTLRLEEMWVAEALWQSDGRGRADLVPLGEPEEMRFTAGGHLEGLPLPSFHHGRKPWE